MDTTEAKDDGTENVELELFDFTPAKRYLASVVGLRHK